MQREIVLSEITFDSTLQVASEEPNFQEADRAERGTPAKPFQAAAAKFSRYET